MSQVTDYRKGVRALTEAQWSKSLYHNQEKTPLFYETRALWVSREIAARENMQATTFKTRTETEGEPVTLIRLRQIGIDQENHPVYEETWTSVKGFCTKETPSERELGAGTLIEQSATFQLPYDADVDETEFEVLCRELRWKIVGITVYLDHLEVRAERKP